MNHKSVDGDVRIRYGSVYKADSEYLWLNTSANPSDTSSVSSKVFPAVFLGVSVFEQMRETIVFFVMHNYFYRAAAVDNLGCTPRTTVSFCSFWTKPPDLRYTFLRGTLHSGFYIV